MKRRTTMNYEPVLGPDDLQAVQKSISELTLGADALDQAKRSPWSPFSRIIVGVDGSDASTYALEWAALLGRRFDASIRILCVAPSKAPFDHYAKRAGAWSQYLDFHAESHEDATQVAAEARERLRATGVDAEIEILTGSPGEALVAFASQDRADLIIVGAHGHSKLDRFLLGSVSETVKDGAGCSVLIARGSPKGPVLAATDGSAMSLRAVHAGIEIAAKLASECRVLHAHHVPAFGRSKDAEKTVGKWLRHNRQIAARQGVRYDLVLGPPAAQILQEDAPLTVVGSRGLSGVRSLLPGSVSDRVARGSKHSVLIIK
jgi:nucleotide-binding universal stress UspA family protein